MKKIININLSGRVIPIEDSAYEKLQAYIESLRRYFAHEEGRDEIINDIESRIAELMNEKVRKGAPSVTEADIEEIIASMGRPEDFDAAEENLADAANTGRTEEKTYTNRKQHRRLYRDTSDKFLGGVCSGIANYLNTDPAIIRILFAIITLGGFGLGFLLYILLWLFLPASDLEMYSGKRLFRNPDDKVIGGVAGGLGAYFNMRASTVRLIFAAPFLLSILISILTNISVHPGFDFFPNIVFGSLGGTFLLAYIVLWMVLPEARSPYEKMEMRGEKVDVNTIRQNVKEGMENVKDRMHTWKEEVKESANQFGDKAREFTNTRGRAFAQEVREAARSGGRGIGHVIGVLFKAFFLFIAGTIAFALFVAMIALIFGGVAWWPVNNFLWTSKWQQIYAWGTLIFFLAVPLIGFIVWVIRRVMRVRSRHSYLGWTFGFLWTLGWISAILLATSLAKDFRRYDHVDQELSISQPQRDRMIVAVSQPELEYNGRFGWFNEDGEGWDLTEDTMKLSTIRFNVKASVDSIYHVYIKRFSYGSSAEEARHRASRMDYTAYSHDSILDLGNGYSIDKISKFRGQQVEIEIRIPIGKKIRFDRSVNDKLNPTSFRMKIRRNDRNSPFDSEEYVYMNRFRDDIDYVMGADGDLRDINGKALIDDEPYRYHDARQDSINIKRELEEEKRKNRESQERIKQLEEQQRQQKSSGKAESMDDEDASLSFRSIPGFSVAKVFFN